MCFEHFQFPLLFARAWKTNNNERDSFVAVKRRRKEYEDNEIKKLRLMGTVLSFSMSLVLFVRFYSCYEKSAKLSTKYLEWKKKIVGHRRGKNT